MRHPLYVAFIWHMHQPFYKDGDRGDLALPWVRLHAVKDYLHMVEVLEDYPYVHATFNIVPSMVEQLQGYVDCTVVDRAWEVSLREDLTLDDKRYVDSLFFSVNRDRLIRLYPRYEQICRLREEAAGDLDLLSDTYWKDLIAWFNLAWIDPSWLRRDPTLRALVAKGSHFTRDDIVSILSKHQEAMAVTLAAYRRLQRRGQVELSVTPYYHPILPLLIDSDCATEPSPWLRLPDARYRRPEDALEQLNRAVSYHEECFGRAPAGLWPSEGAVSQELVGLLSQLPQIRWMATDEAILARSFGRGMDRNAWGYLTDPRFLYQPYWARSGDHRVAMVFRDHYLSDRVGFTYQGMSGHQAAEDLVFRFACIHEAVKFENEPYLVSVILDGENCWEHYEQNGETFLRALYEKLSGESWVRAVTVSEFLNQFPPRHEIPRLATGSWINGNLETWIGEDTQNRGWEYLHRTREALADAIDRGDLSENRVADARRAMLAAEGSDWFWWYYSHNVSDQDDLFDALFRRHLAAVYRAIGCPEPDWIRVPIVALVPKLSSRAARGFVQPAISPAEFIPSQWDRAGYLEPVGSTGSMQQSSGLFKRLYFGYDRENIYLRLESHASLQGYQLRIHLGRLSETIPGEPALGDLRPAEVRRHSGAPFREITVLLGEGAASIGHWAEDGGWRTVQPIPRLAVADGALELATSLDSLGLSLGVEIGISVVLFKDTLVVQRLPEDGEVVLQLR